MDGLLTLLLEAHNPAANHHRWYEVRVGRDLFGRWTVCIAYGRSGQAGQQRRFSAAVAADLKACVFGHLVRRLSAPRRIGCAYRVTRLDAAEGFDTADWLAPSLMTGLSDPTGSQH